MHPRRFDRLVRQFVLVLTAATPRRELLRSAAVLGAAAAASAILPGETAARKKKKCPGCCQANGTLCKRTKKTCKKAFCLKTPLTIEAHWTNPAADYDTFFFLPNPAGVTLPSPYIDYGCTAARSDCENDVYPFTCVSQDAAGPGDEVTTVRRLIAGTYEYWIEMSLQQTPAGDVSVRLFDQNGRFVRSWNSPPNPNVGKQFGWHVFDLHGKTGSITSVNQTIDTSTLPGAHSPSTYVCPGL